MFAEQGAQHDLSTVSEERRGQLANRNGLRRTSQIISGILTFTLSEVGTVALNNTVSFK